MPLEFESSNGALTSDLECEENSPDTCDGLRYFDGKSFDFPSYANLKIKFDHKSNEARACLKWKNDNNYHGKLEAKKCSESKVILCKYDCEMSFPDCTITPSSGRGWRYDGNPIASSREASASDCSIQCNLNANCAYWSWMETGECRLIPEASVNLNSPLEPGSISARGYRGCVDEYTPPVECQDPPGVSGSGSNFASNDWDGSTLDEDTVIR